MKRPNICPLGPTNFENDITKITYAGFSQGTDALLGFKLVKGDPSLRQVILNAGYAENSAEFVFALAIGTKEGWNPKANGGVGSRSYRNNNPGNLDYSINLKRINQNISLENNPYGENRFALFQTAELGVKVLIENKIKRWANGNMPITAGNTKLIEQKNGGKQYKSGTSPTLAQFVYTYAPPNENNTEKYITDLLKDLIKFKPDSARTTPLNKFFK
jgi:hypothetical protein